MCWIDALHQLTLQYRMDYINHMDIGQCLVEWAAKRNIFFLYNSKDASSYSLVAETLKIIPIAFCK